MAEFAALPLVDLPIHGNALAAHGDTNVLVIRLEDDARGKPNLVVVEAECPHAKAPLVKGAVCDGKLVCPWHAGTFDLRTGALLEPPPLRALKHFPVRIDIDGQIMIDDQPIRPATSQARLADKHFVLVGAGAASAAAACFLREHGFAGNLSLVDPVGDEPVDRTALSKAALAGQMTPEKLPLLDAATQQRMREQSGSHVAFNHVTAAVTAIEPDKKLLHLSNGNELHYDAALLAPGLTPCTPGIPGERNDNVVTMRHAADLRKLESLIAGKAEDETADVVIAGDSFIAFEAAASLRTRKPPVNVTVVAKSERPLAKKFGEEIAAAIMKLHADHGVTVMTRQSAAVIDGHEVTLESGKKLHADAVLIAIGAEPATAFAIPDDPFAPHVKIEKKDRSLKTSRDLKLDKQLWAAGDAVTVDGTRIEHWRLAEQHGRVAAAAMLDVHAGNTPAQYDGVPFFWTAYYGKSFRYVGHADSWDEIVIDGSAADLTFLAYYILSGKVAAVFSCGRDGATAALTIAMKERLTLEKARAVAAKYEV